MAILDPKSVLRTTRPDDGGRLPVMTMALAAAKLDPMNIKAVDNIDEALSHFQGVADDVLSRLAPHGGNAAGLEKTVEALNAAILDGAGYRGDQENYDDLANANLFRVIERRIGLPVALGIIYIHVGRLAGLGIAGVGFPGHFMLRLDCGRERGILDPFFGGIMRDAAGMRDMLKSVVGQDAELTAEHYDTIDDMTVLIRLQNNIKHRLLRAERHSEAAQVVDTMLMMSPKDASLWREAGLLHAHDGNLRAALAALTNFVDLEPRGDLRAPVEALMADLQRQLN